MTLKEADSKPVIMTIREALQVLETARLLVLKAGTGLRDRR